MDVDIEYCDACGGLGMAVEVRDRLRDACGDDVGAIEVTPVEDGTFRVRAGGEEVFSTDRAEYEPRRVVDAVCERAT